jgi:cytochrome P450
MTDVAPRRTRPANDERRIDWDPRAEAVLSDQLAAYDRMRRQCPVARSEYLHWSVFRHADVMRILEDHETFSSRVSGHLSVPNGMDPPEHSAFRAVIEPYFNAARMAEFAAPCRAIAVELVDRLPRGEALDLMPTLGEEFALRIQCAFMGWPEGLHEPLRTWNASNRAATLSGDRAATADVALEFDGFIRAELDRRRAAGGQVPGDVTARLLAERVGGRPLSDEQIVSIVRNWTVGELGTIASCVGILAHALAARPALQQELRGRPDLLDAAIDELLRSDAPLIANRRVTTRAVELGGREIGAGERLTLIWASANRDETVFGDPDALRLDREPGLNLLYGAGIHACPGAPLARLELRVLMEELLGHTRALSPVAGRPAIRARYPAGGFSSVPVRLA